MPSCSLSHDDSRPALASFVWRQRTTRRPLRSASFVWALQTRRSSSFALSLPLFFAFCLLNCFSHLFAVLGSVGKETSKSNVISCMCTKKPPLTPSSLFFMLVSSLTTYPTISFFVVFFILNLLPHSPPPSHSIPSFISASHLKRSWTDSNVSPR